MAGIAGMGRPQNIASPVGAQNIGNMLTPQVVPSDIPAPVSDAPMSGVPNSAVPQPEVNPFADLEMSADENPFADLEAPEPTHDEIAMNNVRKMMGYADDEHLQTDPVTSIKRSFATTGLELQGVLQNKFGTDNVRSTTDGFEVKENGKWKKLTDDVLSNYSRIALEGGIAVGGTIAAGATAIGASAATLGAATPLGIAATVAGNAASAVAGKEAADFTAEHILGIKRDPSRSRVWEDSKTALIGGSLGLVAKTVGGYLAQRAAARATLSQLDTASVKLEQTYIDAQDDLKVLERFGVKPKIGMNMATEETQALSPLSQAQMVPTAENLSAEAGLESSKSMRMYRAQQEKAWSDSFDHFTNQHMNYTEVEADLGNKFQKTLAARKETAGKGIQNLRTRFVEEAGDGELPVNATHEAVINLRNTLGIKTTETGNLVQASAEDIAASLKTTPQVGKTVKEIIDPLNDAIESGAKGRLDAQTILNMREKVANELETLSGSKHLPEYKLAYKQLTVLKKALSQDETQLMGTVLGEKSGVEYQAFNKQYSEYHAAVKVFKEAAANPVTNESLANSIYGGGQKGLSRMIKAEKVLADEPDLLASIKGQRVLNAVNNATETINGVQKVNWLKVGKELDKMGQKGLETFWGSAESVDASKAFFRSLARARVVGTSKVASQNIVSDLLHSFSKTGMAQKAVQAIFSQETQVLKVITDEGIEKFVGGMSKPEQAYVRDVVDNALALAKKTLPNQAVAPVLYSKSRSR